MIKCCRNCEHDHLASCKGCNTNSEAVLQWQNFEPRKELVEPKRKPIQVKEGDFKKGHRDWAKLYYEATKGGLYFAVYEDYNKEKSWHISNLGNLQITRPCEKNLLKDGTAAINERVKTMWEELSEVE